MSDFSRILGSQRLSTTTPANDIFFPFDACTNFIFPSLPPAREEEKNQERRGGVVGGGGVWRCTWVDFSFHKSLRINKAAIAG